MPAGVVTLAASAQVKGKAGQLVAVTIAAGADAATVTISDNTATAGTIVVVLKAPILTTVSFCPAVPIACGVGIYATITGTTPSVTVVFQ